MKQRTLWIFSALLATTCVAQGYYIHSQQRPQARRPEPPAAMPGEDEWLEHARKRMLKGPSIPLDDFDALSADRAFDRIFDPFAEILRLPDRAGFTAIEAKTRETETSVVMELRIPGLDKDSLNIDVNESRVRVAYDARDVQNKKDGSGREYFRSESIRHFEKVMPVPENADGRGSRIEREGDVVKIIFPRRLSGVKADF